MSVASPVPPSFVTDSIDWADFLARADMKWNYSTATLPVSWKEAAFTGNGLLSLSASHSSNDTLRFHVGRADVWACGSMPILPIGHLEWKLPATVVSGEWRQHLHDAILTANLTLADGSSAWFTAWTAATTQAIVFEHGFEHGVSQSTASTSFARFVPDLPVARGMAGPIGPPPTFTNSTDTLGRTEVY